MLQVRSVMIVMMKIVKTVNCSKLKLVNSGVMVPSSFPLRWMNMMLDLTSLLFRSTKKAASLTKFDKTQHFSTFIDIY